MKQEPILLSARVRYPVSLIAVFLWIGFVCSISFMEAWLKFRAPGVSLALGLGIGRLVFAALNKVEWVFALLIALHLLVADDRLLKWRNLLYLLPLGLLTAQSAWLLPALDARAGLYMEGRQVPPSGLHFYYVGMEVLKVLSLFFFGITHFKRYRS